MNPETRFVLVDTDTDCDLDVTPSALGKADLDCKPSHKQLWVVAHRESFNTFEDQVGIPE